MYEEIVKALRNCGFPYDVHYCRKCVCQLEHGGSCDCRRLFPRAADAIEKQQKLNCELLFRVGQAEALIDYYQTGRMTSNALP